MSKQWYVVHTYSGYENKVKASLEERFAQIDIKTVRKELQAAQASVEKVPSQIRKLIAVPTFAEIISNLFQKAA